MNGRTPNAILREVVQDLEDINEKLLDCQEQFWRSGNWEMVQKIAGWGQKAEELLRTIRASVKAEENHYPRFVIQDDSLEKIALRGDKTSVYKQSVSKDDFDQIIIFLDQLAAEKTGFTANYLKDEFDHPDYIIYLVLAFLKENGMLEVPTRGRYEFTNRENFRNEVEEIWNRIKQKDI